MIPGIVDDFMYRNINGFGAVAHGYTYTGDVVILVKVKYDSDSSE